MSLVIARAGPKAALVGKPLPLGSFLPQDIQWVQLPESVLLFEVAYDNPSEGMVGTALYRLDADSLHEVFTDGSDACAPASLRDLNADGIPELVVYSEDPSHGDCGEGCLVTVRDTFDVIAGWVQVRRWRSGAFVADEPEFPEFYRKLGDRYQAVDRWLKSDSPYAARCRGVYWLKNQDLFAGLAQRAQAVAKQGWPKGARLGLRSEVLGCYALYDSSGARLQRTYYNSSPVIRLDSATLRSSKSSAAGPLRYLVRLDTAGRMVRKGGEARMWWADSLTDSIRISFSDHLSGAFVVLAVPDGADTFTGRIENQWDVGPSITDQGRIHARRVPCRAA